MIEQRQDDPNPELLHVAGPEEFLPPINWWITLGGLVLLATLGASVVLAGVLKYRVTVRAPATVRPAGELRIVLDNASISRFKFNKTGWSPVCINDSSHILNAGAYSASEITT